MFVLMAAQVLVLVLESQVLDDNTASVVSYPYSWTMCRHGMQEPTQITSDLSEFILS